MATDIRRNSLGRGLSALLDDIPADIPAADMTRAADTLPIDLIRANPRQPRRAMGEAELEELTRSVAEQGILQPIIVRPHPDEAGAYQIVAGERRWRAAQRVPLHTIPVIVRELDDRQVLELAVIENLQRQDLTPVEEAVAYQRLADEFGYTQEAIAERVSKSRSHVANLMRLLSLPESVQAMVQGGTLSAGHARALIGMADPEAVARDVIRRGLTVRQTEKLIQGMNAAPATRGRTAAPVIEKDANTAALERDLSNLLGLGVEIHFRGGGGSLVLHYGSVDQLDVILHRLSRGAHGAPARRGGDDWRAGDGGSFSDSDPPVWETPEEDTDDLQPPDLSGVINDLLKR